MEEKKATIGRIVRFVPPSTDHPAANNGAEVVPAMVTRAWSEETVNMTVFPDARDPFAMTSVPYNREGAAGSWHWPEDAERVADAQAAAAKSADETPTPPADQTGDKSGTQE